ncbi:hypothetical protein Csa_016234 [Cucumis sativus]|nr:hypothetical protein Csa_016234 [Cucumis sativus]
MAEKMAQVEEQKEESVIARARQFTARKSLITAPTYTPRCTCYQPLVMAEFSHAQTTLTNNVLTQGQHLSIGSQLISSTATFVLGFYNPPSSNSTYLGISYNTNDQKPIWIANRNSPFPNNSASISLTIDVNGSLKIQSGNYFFSLFNGGQPTTSSAILQDDGNFVLREMNRDGSVKQIVWQSFDHPTDTLLPRMKIGINHKTNSTWSLTSWRSDESPKPGAFRLGMNPNNTYELVMFIQDDLLWRSGNWKDGSFEFLASYISKGINFNRVSNENETYFIYYIPGLHRYSVYENSYDYEGSREFILPQWTLENDGVLIFNNQQYFPLVCLNSRNEMDSSCVRRKQEQLPECRNELSYGYGPGFSVINGYKGERINGSNYYYEQSGNLTTLECHSICMNDCDCIAFAIPAYGSDSGCEFWKSVPKFIPDYDSSQTIWSLMNTNYKSRNGKAWELWVNGRGEELIDLGLCNSDDQKAKALRCIHVSLLCVQQIPGNRPTMLDIYFMINNDSAQLPSPKQPAFFIAQNPSSFEREMEEVDSELIRPIEPTTPEIYSLNSMTLSTMVAR